MQVLNCLCLVPQFSNVPYNVLPPSSLRCIFRYLQCDCVYCWCSENDKNMIDGGYIADKTAGTAPKHRTLQIVQVNSNSVVTVMTSTQVNTSTDAGNEETSDISIAKDSDFNIEGDNGIVVHRNVRVQSSSFPTEDQNVDVN